MRGAKVLVTGGCGFIGGHLVQRLVMMGAKVMVWDIVLDPRSQFYQNELKKNVELVFVDIRNREKVLNNFKKNRPNFVIHLAAQPIVEDAYQNPFETFQTNVLGTVNVLDAIRPTTGIKAAIIASSDKAYGKSSKQYKEDFPLKGDHPYDVSKSCEDLIAQSYYKTYNLPIVITRFGNVYGQGDLHFGRIIPDICKSIVQKKILSLRSDGKSVRDYIYTDDVVDGYILLLKSIQQTTGEAYNFSSSDTLSVLELIKKAEQILKVSIPIEILNNTRNEIPYQHLNDSKIRKLGYFPKHNLNNSLKKVLPWYKELLKTRKII